MLKINPIGNCEMERLFKLADWLQTRVSFFSQAYYGGKFKNGATRLRDQERQAAES